MELGARQSTMRVEVRVWEDGMEGGKPKRSGDGSSPLIPIDANPRVRIWIISVAAQ